MIIKPVHFNVDSRISSEVITDVFGEQFTVERNWAGAMERVGPDRVPYWVIPTNITQVSGVWSLRDYGRVDGALGILKRLEGELPPLDTPPDEEQESSLGTIMNQWESEKERVERTYREVIKHYNSFITPHGLETIEVEEGLTPEEQLERCDVMLREMIELRNTIKARRAALAKRHSDVRERFGDIVGRRSSDEGEE